MKTVAIIQARMSSTRLPGKVLANILGKPLLFYVVERARACPLLDEVLVATTDEVADDMVVYFCREEGIPFFRGDPDDVLKRYADAARFCNADIVVRITADCPLIDPEIIGKVIEQFRKGQCDYATNVLNRTYPRGLDTEVFSREILERLDCSVHDSEDREHVTRYIYCHPSKFRIASVTHPKDFSQHRWTVDTLDDLAFVRTVYAHFGHHTFSWRELTDILKDHPEWCALNQHVPQKPLF
ncbi:MAG: acylneuraminate cytidylyltransferase [Parcubacteria group bacterium RIFCSPHIGHO2_01_FULL_56_18]|nr:MAG: acylneuraminate cytidylyltransferase [Parcubacteria group bacterium RIFCSPHIGHO2_01_FULL_56_18]